MDVIDLEKLVGEMAALRERVQGSGVLAEVQALDHLSEQYVRRARRAMQALEPQAELVGLPEIEPDPEVGTIATMFGANREMLERALHDAEQLRAYAGELERLWRGMLV